MLNPQRSPHRSTTTRRTRPSLQESSSYSPDIFSYVRQIPPMYLGGAGLLITIVGLMSSAGWLPVVVGVALTIAAGVMSAIRPRTRVVYWRGRRIELPNESSGRSSLGRWLGRR